MVSTSATISTYNSAARARFIRRKSCFHQSWANSRRGKDDVRDKGRQCRTVSAEIGRECDGAGELLELCWRETCCLPHGNTFQLYSQSGVRVSSDRAPNIRALPKHRKQSTRVNIFGGMRLLSVFLNIPSMQQRTRPPMSTSAVSAPHRANY